MLSRAFRKRAAALGIATNPAFAGTYDFTAQDVDFAALFPGFLDRLPAGGLIMCHPGMVDAELERLDPLTLQREREYAFLAGEGFPAMLRRMAWPWPENSGPSVMDLAGTREILSQAIPPRPGASYIRCGVHGEERTT